MRIAFISATPASVRAGSGTHVAETTLASGLQALGHAVSVVHPHRTPGRLGYTLHRFRFNWELRAQAVVGADLVVGWDMDGYRLAGRLPCPFITYVHGQLADEARFERGLVAASMRLQALAERSSARRASRVLTVSAYGRRRLAALYDIPAHRIGVVPPALDVARWRAALASAEKGRGGPPTVLSVAHMYRRKNLAGLVCAAAAVRRRVPNLRVVLAGDGPERPRLARLVRRLGLSECVSLPGHLDFTALVQAYAMCDVFCLPSLQEGFGIVLLEALAAGKPIVACRGTAAQEIVTDDVTGVLVPPHDVRALAAALEALLTDEARWRRAAEAGPRLAAAFAPEPVAERFLTVSLDDAAGAAG